MNKTAIVLLTILVMSILAFTVFYFLIGYSVGKSLAIAGGAAVFMIIFDVIGLGGRKRSF